MKKFKTKKIFNKNFISKILLAGTFILITTLGNNTFAAGNCNCVNERNKVGACQGGPCCSTDCTFSYWGKTFLQPRSQNTNTVRRSVGSHKFRHKFGREKFASTFTITPEYGQSFKPYHIAQYFFSADTLNFAGSMVTGRAQNNLLADYFGLSTEYFGSVQFRPQIKTFLVDFDWMLEFSRGLYLQIYSPVVKTWWQMQMLSDTQESGAGTLYPTGYMASGQVTPPVYSIPKALEGGVTFGDLIDGSKYGKFSCCPLETTKLADITFLLGWIFLNREDGYVGVNFQATVPTGTRPNNTYIFEPVAGNGHHWEFNIGFKGTVLLWEKDEKETVDFHFDANFGTLFNTCQRRSFDFKCNKFFSRYMLLKEFDQNGDYIQIVPAINVTTLKCDVKVGFQMDLNLMIAYNNPDWEFDFGYNGWLRSHEEICLLEQIPENKYGFKGIQNVGGLQANLTQSTATIYGNPFDQQAQVADEDSPVFICTSSLDISSAANPKVMTHKFYSHLSHKWERENKTLAPYLGMGAQIEFESLNPRIEYPYKITINQWALWLKAGIAYN